VAIGAPRASIVCEMDSRLAKPALALLLSACLLLLLAAAGGAQARAAAARPASATPLGGVNVDLGPGSTFAEADRVISEAHQLHAQVVRIDLPWATFEPNGPGQIDPRALAVTDRLFADAASDGIRVVAIADASPCWASSAPASLLSACSPTHLSQANAYPPTDPASYAAFVAFIAQRYGSKLAAIEIWNEPDQANQAYFAGPQKAQRYAAVLRAAYPAIKQADAQVPVLAGSLVGSNGVFLRALYAAGIKGFYDGLSVHFYHLTLASLRSIHEVQLANGDSKPLWLNEFGWSSCWPQQKTEQEQACVTAQTQALNLRNMFRALARTPYIAAEIVYKLQSSTREEFGALNARGARKPSFAALAGVLSSPLGSVSPVTLSVRRHGRAVVASGSGPVGDFMRLEVLHGTVLRYTALFVLDRFNQFSIALPRALGSSGLRVRVFQYWMGPARGASKSI
jgi:polysaccharide biosynthesis protein PslG